MLRFAKKFGFFAIISTLIILISVCTAEPLEGPDLLKAIRKESGHTPKPSYSQRQEEIKSAESDESAVELNVDPAEEPVYVVKESIEITEVYTQAPIDSDPVDLKDEQAGSLKEAPEGDYLLKMVPADSLACVRINNFEYALNALDQYLTGVSPLPVSLSMMVKGQLGMLTGNFSLVGMDLSGDVVIFATEQADQMTPQVNILIPIASYDEFIAASPALGSADPNISQPDSNGVFKITSSPLGPVLLKKISDKYVAVATQTTDSGKFAAFTESLSGLKDSVLKNLDQAESNKAASEPIWVYGNTSVIVDMITPMISAQMQQAKVMFQNDPNMGQIMTTNIEFSEKMYAVFADYMKQAAFISWSIKPSSDKLVINNTLAAKDATELADILSVQQAPAKENKLLRYLSDDAAVSVVLRANSPVYEKINTLMFDSFIKDVDEDTRVQIKEVMAKSMELTGDFAVMSMSAATGSELMPFAVKYIVEIKDMEKYDKMFEESMQLWEKFDYAKAINSNISTSYKVARGIETYKGVSIDSMTVTIANASIAVEDMSMDYRLALTEDLFLCAIGGDVDLGIKQMIDEVKTKRDSKKIPVEIEEAMYLDKDAQAADAFMTLNYIRVLAFSPAGQHMSVPISQVPTTSNIVITVKISDKKVNIKTTIPKEHLGEIFNMYRMSEMAGTSNAVKRGGGEIPVIPAEKLIPEAAPATEPESAPAEVKEQK